MSIFKACDIRGTYGRELTDADALRLGQAVGARAKGRTVVVGGDVRLSTPALKAALLQGLLATGAEVLDIGIVPTPALYFAKARLAAWGSVMVTASHNPAPDNGFKVMLGNRPPTEEDLAQIEREMAAGDWTQQPGSLRQIDILPQYEDSLLARFAPVGYLRLVLDCGNGCYSDIAPRVLGKLGYRVEPLFCTPDGRFPNRNPNPAAPGSLQELSRHVVEGGADLGLAFDGDGDRIQFVDHTGAPTAADRVAVLIARWLLRHEKGDVVYDIKSSSVLPEAVAQAGGRAIAERSGHTFIKTTLLERNARLGAEISGHYFFRELGGDDGLYAACLLLAILQARGRSLASLIAEVPRYPITPDIRIPCPPAQVEAILRQLASAFAGQPVSLLDGVRVDFGDGWALARPSVTEPLITMRFEAHTPARLQEIQALVRARTPELAAIWK